MSVLYFFILQLINVVLGTLRSLSTIKSNMHVGMLLNTISYTFYAVITKMITQQPFIIIIIITAITNSIGYYIAYLFFNKMQKDKIWHITAISAPEEKSYISDELNKYNIKYYYYKTKNKVIFTIYSYSQKDSLLIKNILQNKQIKNFAIEIKQSL